MRIAFHVPRASYLEPGFSGDHVFVLGLLSGLRERGHEVRIVSPVDVQAASSGRTPARQLLREAIRVRRLATRFEPDAWLVYGARAKHPDLFCWWQHPRRYVLFAAGAGKTDAIRRYWRPLFRSAHRRSLARADRVVAYRPKVADLLRRADVPSDRLAVLPLAIEMWEDVPSQHDARRQLELPVDVPVILSVSRLTRPRDNGRPWKTEMVTEVVRAMPALPEEAVLVVVGDGNGRERVEAEVAKLGLHERVRLAGRVVNADLPAYYGACDIFALPDLRDFPWLTVLEAQSCARPVVTTDTRASRLTIDAGRTGLLAQDLDEFRIHLGELAGDRARCRRMGGNGRDYVRRFHSLDVRIDQIEEMLAGERVGDDT